MKAKLISGYKKDPRVLLLGDQRLEKVSELVKKSEIKKVEKNIKIMHEILMAYKKEYGKFRAIAAPQIGINKRFIYMFVDEPVVVINPILKNKSKEMMAVWDDCMSFPDLLVKVKRHKNVVLEFYDLNWKKHEINLNGDLSELIQHEYDHLDGVLATHRAVGLKSFAVFKKK